MLAVSFPLYFEFYVNFSTSSSLLVNWNIANSGTWIFTSQLPDNGTWNGEITHIVLLYWIADSSVTEANSSLVVFSNVSMTTGTLRMLRQDEVYEVTAKICTSAGCGPPSQSVFIRRLDHAGLFSLRSL